MMFKVIQNLFEIAVIGLFCYCTIGFILIPVFHCIIGKYSAECLEKRIKGLEHKLTQYCPHIHWNEYVTEEERAD